MRIVFDTHTYIYANSMEEFKKIYDLVFLHLRFINPEFEKGRQVNVQAYFELFDIDYKNFIFKLPKNIKNLINDLITFGIKIESFENKRINKNEHIGFKATFEPRDEQQKNSIDLYFETFDKHAVLGALCG